MKSHILRYFQGFYLYKKLKKVFSKSSVKSISKFYLYTRSLKRNISGEKIKFVSIEDLILWTSEWIKSFSLSYDIIVGIPRSGLLVANIIASKLAKPLTTPELFCQNKDWVSSAISKKEEYRNILLVDDSIYSGNTMDKALKLICSSKQSLNITKAALIVNENSKNFVDSYYKIIPHPRVFEWNILHAKRGVIAVDLDGVLCENCPKGVDFNEELYVNWIKTAKPYLIPNFEIDFIVSCRLEKYRFYTESWLLSHNVKYKELILWNLASKEERKGKYAQYKIEQFLKIKPDMIWESNFTQAKKIWQATRIPTLCIDEMVLFS